MIKSPSEEAVPADAEFLARGIQIVGKAVQGLRSARNAQAEEIIDQALTETIATLENSPSVSNSTDVSQLMKSLSEKIRDDYRASDQEASDWTPVEEADVKISEQRIQTLLEELRMREQTLSVLIRTATASADSAQSQLAAQYNEAVKDILEADAQLAEKRRQRDALVAQAIDLGSQLESLEQPLFNLQISSGREILHEGYLTKQGHIVKNWKRRFFSLALQKGKGAILYYFAAPADLRPAGLINLQGAELKEISELQFQLKTSNGKVYLMTADSPTEMGNWMVVLAEALRTGL